MRYVSVLMLLGISIGCTQASPLTASHEVCGYPLYVEQDGIVYRSGDFIHSGSDAAPSDVGGGWARVSDGVLDDGSGCFIDVADF